MLAAVAANSTGALDQRGAAWQRALLPGDYAADSPGGARSPRDWVVDGFLFVASVAVGAVVFHTQRGQFELLNASVGLLACISLWWRRSHPFAVGMFTAFGSCVAGASGIAWLIALYNCALRLGRRELVAVLVLSAIGFVTYPFMYPPDEGLVTSIFLGVGVAGASLGMGLIARARREHVQALATAAEVAASEQRVLELRAREEERRRIAREMHDVLAHRISLLSLHAAALEYRKDASPEEVTQAAAVIRESAQEALQELRDVIGVMRTGADASSDPPQPSLADIPRLVVQFREAGLRVHFDAELDPAVEVGPAAGRTLYRVAQEGLVNASKHAPGAKVEIKLARASSHALSITVENELGPAGGVAAVSLDQPGLGLVGLAERVDLVGGSLEHGARGTRFELKAEVPIGDA